MVSGWPLVVSERKYIDRIRDNIYIYIYMYTEREREREREVVVGHLNQNICPSPALDAAIDLAKRKYIRRQNNYAAYILEVA